MYAAKEKNPWKGQQRTVFHILNLFFPFFKVYLKNKEIIS